MRWKVLGVLVFTIIVALFTLQNAEQVTVHFGFGTLSVQLIIVLLVSLLLGMALMTVFWAMHAWKLRKVIGEWKARVEQLEEQLTAMTPTVEPDATFEPDEVSTEPGSQGAAGGNGEEQESSAPERH